MKVLDAIKKFKWGYIFLALITAAIGICFLAFGNDSLHTLAIVIGVVIIVGAIVLAVSALAAKERGFAFGAKISFSVAMLIAGIVTVIARETTINVMVGIFGLIMIIDGSFKFHTTAMSKRYKLWCWIFMLVVSVILIAVGYITIRRLTIENSITVYVLGSLFVVDSIANFFSAFFISAYEKRSEEEIRDKVYSEIEAEEKLFEKFDGEVDFSDK